MIFITLAIIYLMIGVLMVVATRKLIMRNKDYLFGVSITILGWPIPLVLCLYNGDLGLD